MMIRRLCFYLMMISILLPVCASAENLGVYGALYTIAEPDMLKGIHKKLEMMQANGELERQKQAFIRRSISHILRPVPVSGVSDLGASKPAQHFYDPSITLDHDILNTTGQIVAMAGTVVNPLTRMQFDEALLFINGDNSKQLDWASNFKRSHSKEYTKTKIILINGDIKLTAKKLKSRVYFDQAGFLCHKFNITHTPTLIAQAKDKGNRLPQLLVKEFSYE